MCGQYWVNGWRVNWCTGSFSGRRNHPASSQCRRYVGLRLYPLCIGTFSSLLKTSLVRTACYWDEKTLGAFWGLKVNKDNSLQIIPKAAAEGEWAVLTTSCNEVAWALITAREILSGHQGKHSDGKDREAQEGIAWGEQRLCCWRPLRKGQRSICQEDCRQSWSCPEAGAAWVDLLRPLPTLLFIICTDNTPLAWPLVCWTLSFFLTGKGDTENRMF